MPPTTAPIRCQTCGRLVSALHFETTPSHVRSPESTVAPSAFPLRFVVTPPPSPFPADTLVPVSYRREVEVPGEVLALQESPGVEGKGFSEITSRPEVTEEVEEDRSRPNPDYVNPPAELLSPDAKTTEELTADLGDEFPLPDPDTDPEADISALKLVKLSDLRADPTLDNEPAANETL